MAQDLPRTSFVSRLWSGRLENWELHSCHEPAGLCPLRTQGAGDDAGKPAQFRCLDIRTADAAMDRLRACVTHADDMVTLRDVVRDDALPLSRLGNHQVIEQVAAMIARRKLCVVIAVPAVQSGFLEPVSKPARPAGVTPSQLRPRIAEEPDIEFDDVMNVPAAVLVEAARSGTPFCEH